MYPANHIIKNNIIWEHISGYDRADEEYSVYEIKQNELL